MRRKHESYRAVSSGIVILCIIAIGMSGLFSSPVLLIGDDTLQIEDDVDILLGSDAPYGNIGNVSAGDAYGIDLNGDTAYIADHSFGLRVVDISDPRNPVAVGSYDSPNLPQHVTVSGNIAYLADAYGGLICLDITKRA